MKEYEPDWHGTINNVWQGNAEVMTAVRDLTGPRCCKPSGRHTPPSRSSNS